MPTGGFIIYGLVVSSVTLLPGMNPELDNGYFEVHRLTTST